MSTPRTAALRAHGVMAIQTLLIGPSYTFGALAAKAFDPLVLLQLRFWGAAIIMVPIFFALGGFNNFKPSRKLWWQLAGLSIIGVMVNQNFFVFGLSYTTPANGALIYSLTPLIVLLLAVYILRDERLSSLKLTGVLVAIAGVALIMLYSLQAEVQAAPNVLLGNLLCLGGVTFWSTYVALSRSFATKFSGIQVAAVAMVIAAVVYTPIGAPRVISYDFSGLPTEAWIGVAWLILVNSVLTYVMVTYALQTLRSSQVAVYINLQPITATIFSVLYGTEQLTLVFVAGGLTTLSGLFILNLAQRRLQARELATQGQ